MHLIKQAVLADGFLLDPPSLAEDGLVPTEVDVGGRDVAEALGTSPVVVVVDEVTDGGSSAPGRWWFLSRMRFFRV